MTVKQPGGEVPGIVQSGTIERDPEGNVVSRTLPCNMIIGKTRIVGMVTLVRDDARREEIVEKWTRFLADNLTLAWSSTDTDKP